MGKSDVVPIAIHKQSNFYAAAPTNLTIDVKPKFDNINDEEEELTDRSVDMEVFKNQVAGHKINGKDYGMFKLNGTVLKALTKSNRTLECEINFYETMHSTNLSTLVEAREFIPRYYGMKRFRNCGSEIDCLILEDLTKNFKEPCVMDVKIGKRTWDPNSTYEKILKEESKYQDSKRDFGFCIPGFQVYNIRKNELIKYDKEFGKSLTKETLPQALKTFLNGDPIICRSLIVQFLACLWRIQLWMRKQRQFTFYSSSLLFVYDAKRLRELVLSDQTTHDTDEIADDVDTFDEALIKPKLKLQRSTSLYRPLSLAVLNPLSNHKEKVSIGFSGQLTNQGPILKTCCSTNKFIDLIMRNGGRALNPAKNGKNVWQKSIRTLKRTHSFQNNYDKDMQTKKNDYTAILDELCTDEEGYKRSEMWATVKMIDFAHAFPSDHYQLDRNYLDGIDNLIKLFEEFLIDSE